MEAVISRYNRAPEGKHTQLAELAIGDEQSAQRPQTLQSLFAILLHALLVGGGIGQVDRLGIPLLGLPDEVLDQIALVLGKDQVLGLLDDIAGVGDESLALVGELLRRAV